MNMYEQYIEKLHKQGVRKQRTPQGSIKNTQYVQQTRTYGNQTTPKETK